MFPVVAGPVFREDFKIFGDLRQIVLELVCGGRSVEGRALPTVLRSGAPSYWYWQYSPRHSLVIVLLVYCFL